MHLLVRPLSQRQNACGGRVASHTRHACCAQPRHAARTKESMQHGMDARHGRAPARHGCGALRHRATASRRWRQIASRVGTTDSQEAPSSGSASMVGLQAPPAPLAPPTQSIFPAALVSACFKRSTWISWRRHPRCPSPRWWCPLRAHPGRRHRRQEPSWTRCGRSPSGSAGTPSPRWWTPARRSR